MSGGVWLAGWTASTAAAGRTAHTAAVAARVH